MKHLLQTLAQKNAATRLWVTRGLDAALFLGLTFTIMGVFRASSAVRSPNLFQAMAPFTMIVLIVLMANHIENVAAKFRKIIQAGPQVRRSLTLFLMGPNLTALFLTTSADVGLLPARLTSLPILGVLIMLALGLFLHSAVEAQDATGGGVIHKKTVLSLLGQSAPKSTTAAPQSFRLGVFSYRVAHI